MQTINTFSKGMNQDLAKNKFSNENYYNANNIRIITDDGLSTGAVENTRGTKKSFILPNIPTQTYEKAGELGPVVIPALVNLVIIGWCANNNIITIVSKSVQGNNVYNQIWQLTYIESSDTIEGILPSGELDINLHLKYNRKLGISRKLKCFSINENTKFFRFYFTDSLSPLMSINLANEFCLDIPQRSLPINSLVNMQVPYISELGLGNLPNGCIQYFYRLITKDGAITNFSPLSNIFQLNNGNEEGEWYLYPSVSTDLYNDKREADNQALLDESSENGCLVKIHDVDLDYDYIQVGFVIWKQKDSPVIYLIPEEPLTKDNYGNKYFEYYHDGNEPKISITQEELNKLVNVWDVAYTIEEKDNTLYAANTVSSQFDIDVLADNLQETRWDARAYRFYSNGDCDLYKADGSLEASFNWSDPNHGFPDVSTEYVYDAVNPTNYDPNLSKYHPGYLYSPNNSNPLTLGGIGPNVEFKFCTEKLVLDVVEDYPTTIGYGLINHPDIQNGVPLTKNPDYNIIDFTSVDRTNKSFSDLKNPYLASKMTGFARGETYRFFITFYNLKNQPSFSKWIADIRFPEFTDNDGDQVKPYDIAYFSNNELSTKTLGIDFYVRVPQWLYDNISGFSITRVERQEEDKSRLGTGITGRLWYLENKPLSWEDFVILFIELSSEMVTKLMPGHSGVIGAITNLLSGGQGPAELIADMLKTLFENIEQNNPGLKKQLSRSMTEEDLTAFVHAIFDSMSKKIGLPLVGTVVKMYANLVEKIAVGIVHVLFSFTRHKIGWVDEKVYQLAPNSTYLDYNPYTIYSISPDIQFDKYHFKTGDYVQPFKKFELSRFTQDKIVKTFHRHANSGIMHRGDSTASYRKWYKGSLDTSTPEGWYAIKNQSTLDVGEIVKSNFDYNSNKATIMNSAATIKERYKTNGEPIVSAKNIWQKKHITGIGDKKLLMTFERNREWKYFDPSTFLHHDSQMTESQQGIIDYNGLIAPSSLSNAIQALIGSDSNGYFSDNQSISRIIDTTSDWMVQYRRILNKQYGGNSVTERNANITIDCVFVPKKNIVPGGTQNHVRTFSGDTYVGLYAAVNYNYYFEQTGAYEPAGKVKKALIEIFPCESTFNFNHREGRHTFNSLNTADLNLTEQKIKKATRRAKRRAKRKGIDEQELLKLIIPKRFLFDEFKIDPVYEQEKNAKFFIPKPVINTFVETSPNRIWKSKPKQFGELIDSYREFKVLDYLDVEASQGPIRDLINFNGRLFYLQDNGLGIATTIEKSAAATNNGTFTLISSTPLSRYDYISKETGTNQRLSVVKTDSFFTFFDTYRKKLFRYSSGVESLSDVAGLSGFFRTNFSTRYLDIDEIIVGGYYPEYNTLFYTFQKIKDVVNGINSFTISYNLMQNSFESFHDSHSILYLKTNNRLLATQDKEVHQLLKGNRGEYFNKNYSSYITVLTNENPTVTKTFDNYSIYTEVTSNGTNLPNETITKVQAKTDYQDTGLVTLNVSNNQLYTDPTGLIKRRERRWNLDVPRSMNNSGYTTLKERMKDNYILSTFVFDNNANKKFILQDIVTTYRTN